MFDNFVFFWLELKEENSTKLYRTLSTTKLVVRKRRL